MSTRCFFDIDSSLNLTTSYKDSDNGGYPIGLKSEFITGGNSQGNLKVTLRHQPDKAGTNVSAGDITNAGGETDIEVNFTVNIQ